MLDASISRLYLKYRVPGNDYRGGDLGHRNVRQKSQQLTDEAPSPTTRSDTCDVSPAHPNTSEALPPSSGAPGHAPDGKGATVTPP